MKNLYILFIIIVIFFIRCEQQYNINEPKNELIIEAYLLPNNPIKIKIKQAIAYNGESKSVEKVIDNLLINFTINNFVYNLKSIGNGEYILNNSSLIKAGNTFKIDFIYNSILISATTLIPTKPQKFLKNIDSVAIKPILLNDRIGDQIKDNVFVKFSWLNQENEYFYIIIRNLESKPIPIISSPVGQILNPFNFTSKPSITNSIDINSAQFQYYGLHQIILLKVNRDYAKFYNSSFSSQSSQSLGIGQSLITNASGLFTGLNSDTLYFKVVKK